MKNNTNKDLDIWVVEWCPLKYRIKKKISKKKRLVYWIDLIQRSINKTRNCHFINYCLSTSNLGIPYFLSRGDLSISQVFSVLVVPSAVQHSSLAMTSLLSSWISAGYQHRLAHREEEGVMRPCLSLSAFKQLKAAKEQNSWNLLRV